MNNINDLISKLECKWGKFEKDLFYQKQIDMSGGRKRSYLNILFNPISKSNYNFIEKMLDCKLHPELNMLYNQYNGIMLFFESLRIYGIQTANECLYEPSDLVKRNIQIDISSLDKSFENFIVFGHYSSCLFCYDKNDFKYLYVIDKNQNKIVYKFASMFDLLNHYISYLVDEYNDDGKKIHYNPKYEGLPMANISTEFI